MKVYELPPLHFAVTVDGVLVQTGMPHQKCTAWIRIPGGDFPRTQHLPFDKMFRFEPEYFNPQDRFWVRKEVKEMWPIPVVDMEKPK